jgi:hypothetical protein
MILHVVPRFVLSSRFHGAYKDVVSRVEWFQRQGEPYHQLVIEKDDEGQLVEVPAVESVQRILVEYTRFPGIVRGLRTRYPHAFLGIRAHNAEPLQHLDNTGWFPPRGPLWMLYGVLRLLRQDWMSVRSCDAVYSISDYENRLYWNRFPGRARVEWMPYFCPSHLLPKNPLPTAERTIIACLPTSQKNRKSWDLVTRFVRFAEAMKPTGASFDFVVTGNLADWGLPESEAVRYVGHIEQLSDFLGQLRAVAVLSPLGYGFKTTILDAMAAGAYVLVHPTIARRCPSQLEKGLISLNTDHLPDYRQLERVSARLATLFPLPCVNGQLRTMSLKVIEQDFGDPIVL